jgi:ring-1,2-phenylacetyl-CoA epoxidase subunit PaaD
MMISIEEIYSYLEEVPDPEVPVLSVLDLGVVRNVEVINDNIRISITPTYSGCPAMGMIAAQIKLALISRGYNHVEVIEQLSPSWTTDWMTIAGKQKLKEYGIAPPRGKAAENIFNELPVQCPRCETENTTVISQFGSTSCKSLYKCNECLEAFDYFKCH